MVAKIVGLFVSPQGGVPKHPVDSLSILTKGCLGDKQNDLKHHGGPSRAVCIFQDNIVALLENSGHPIKPGSTGENILISGTEIGELKPGTILKNRNVELKITTAATPCKTISASFTNGEFILISDKKYPYFTRWYAKVISEGEISLGENMEIIN